MNSLNIPFVRHDFPLWWMNDPLTAKSCPKCDQALRSFLLLNGGQIVTCEL